MAFRMNSSEILIEPFGLVWFVSVRLEELNLLLFVSTCDALGRSFETYWNKQWF